MIAVREKEYGIWQESDWETYAKKAVSLALYYESIGVKPEDRIAIIGDNKPEWVYAELAAQLVGAIPAGIYQDAVVEEVKYLLQTMKATVVVAEDQEQTDKVLELLPELPSVKKIIYYDDKGMYQYDDPRLIYFQDAVSKEKVGAEWTSRYMEGRLKGLGEDEVAVMCTTSGTTGHPKLAMLTHKNLINMAESLAEADPKFEKDEFVSFLPLPWIGEQMMCVVSALRFRFTVNFPESTDTVQADMKEIGPNFVFSPPRAWENMASAVQTQIMDATPFKRYIYHKLLPVGYEYADAKFEKRKPSVSLSLRYRLAYIALFRKLKERMGFSRLRSAMTGGAALGPDTFRFFHALGINLKQIYGQTEISGISCIHRADDVDFTSVGRPIEGTELRLTDDGEIISKSEAVFKGYFANDEATTEALKDGWLYSGDAGYFDESGKLVVIDRMKDMMHLIDGTRFSPQFIENKIKFSPYVREAVTIGGGREYIALMLNIDMGIVGKWAENRKIAYTTYTDLSAKDEVYGLIAAELAKVNIQLPPEMKVRKFVLLYKELDADDGELTRTRKVRRSFVEEKYADIINALYEDTDSVHINARIRLQDGRERTIETDMRLCRMGE
jgi:long-chain acyl-CoA synthetase